MTSVVCFGECLIELKSAGENTYQQGFAGDVFNAAVYLKRWFPSINTKMFTALGIDEFSHQMKTYFASEQIDTDLVLTSKDKIPGLYSIQTDASGERSFTYWRSDAAARYTMDEVTPETIDKLQQCTLFFFSGIGLAILKPEQREGFWQLVEKLKQAGVQIAFDPNYRAKLWVSKEDTKSQYQKALAISDIVLPGVEDFTSIYGHTNFEQVANFCAEFDIPELVIKNGPDGVVVVHGAKKDVFEIEPVAEVVDTTSAGDSFNGAYLGARLTGQNVKTSVALAAKTAGLVIQHPGAILDKKVFEAFKNLHQKGADH